MICTIPACISETNVNSAPWLRHDSTTDILTSHQHDPQSQKDRISAASPFPRTFAATPAARDTHVCRASILPLSEHLYYMVLMTHVKRINEFSCSFSVFYAFLPRYQSLSRIVFTSNG